VISISPIELHLSEKLEKDPEYRKRFFRGQAQDEVASIITSLRKARKKRQIDLARETGMKQSAISRIEQAEYSGWTLKTLFRIADALDARLRVLFEPAELVIEQYRQREVEARNMETELWTVPAQPTVTKRELAVYDLSGEALESTTASTAAVHV